MNSRLFKYWDVELFNTKDIVAIVVYYMYLESASVVFTTEWKVDNPMVSYNFRIS